MRRVVRCTACAWDGQRTRADGECPDCGAAVEFSARPVGRPPSEVQRARLEVRPLATTVEWLGDQPAARAAAMLDRAAKRAARS